MATKKAGRHEARRMMVSLSLVAIALMIVVPVASGNHATTKRMSVRPDGSQADGGASTDPDVSATGRFVVFTSRATNLVKGDTNDRSDVFLRDRKLGKTRRISQKASGKQANGGSLNVALSPNGRYVAFDSAATNLSGSDTNDDNDVYVRDRKTGKLRHVSVRKNGKQGNAGSTAPSVSANGRYVVFESEASNLVRGDTNEEDDVFVQDRRTRKLWRVSVRSDGKQAKGGGSSSAVISANGRYVAFESSATNLVPRDRNGKSDVFVHDLRTGKTKRWSVSSSGREANDHSSAPAISADGRFIAFESWASNLVGADSNSKRDIFVRDRKTKKTRRVSLDSNGVQGNGNDSRADISADGRTVVFQSIASDLVVGDSNGQEDIFARDRKKGTTTRISVDSAEAQSVGGFSRDGAISADGRHVAFESLAFNLVNGDTNTRDDVFLRGPLHR